MISTATGPGAVFLTEEEELTYEWYREIVYSRRRNGRIFKGDLRPFVLVAAVLVAHDPDLPKGERYAIRVFGLRAEFDRRHSYIPTEAYFKRLLQEEAVLPGEKLPPITPRHLWPGETVTLDEIRERFTGRIVKPALQRMVDAHNQPWRESTLPPAVGYYLCNDCRIQWTADNPGLAPRPCPWCGAKEFPYQIVRVKRERRS